jgi:hypothetical protein
VVETGGVRANPGRATAADADLECPPNLVLARAARGIARRRSRSLGVRVAGDVKVLAPLVPSPAAGIPAHNARRRQPMTSTSAAGRLRLQDTVGLVFGAGGEVGTE